ncbi:ParB/RepB/Spo0J family partition protein [Pantoea dispersa]|nr:ParB/RepB/Spo0J family partition protein [Pantoea dispersa]
MSDHETMPETTTKPAVKKGGKKATAPRASVEAVLENAVTVMHMQDALVMSPHQARSMAHTDDEIRALADSIARVGLLQNLAGHTMPDGKTGICAGGGRMKAVMLLTAEGRWPADRPLPVLMVPEDMARVVSMTENGRRRDMHVSEQIVNFRALVQEGRSEGQVADLLGYSVPHVKRCLRLADLSPALLCLLREDRITLEHCQALTLAGTAARQEQVWEAALAGEWGDRLPSPERLRRLATETEISTADVLFEFVGREVYEAAGGQVREDLFSDVEGGFADRLLTEGLALDRLRAMAENVREQEGWQGAEARLRPVTSWGDRDTFRLLPEPEPQFTEKETERVRQLEFVTENGVFDSDEDAQAADDELAQLVTGATVRAWDAEAKQGGIVVASFADGQVYIQRGVLRVADLPADEGNEADAPGCGEGSAVTRLAESTPVPAVEGYSAALVRSLSCERTLAVQAALSRQPDVALTLLAWTLCRQAFGEHGRAQTPLALTLQAKTYVMAQQAHTGSGGRACTEMQEKEAALRLLLPEGWQQAQRSCSACRTTP